MDLMRAKKHSKQDLIDTVINLQSRIEEMEKQIAKSQQFSEDLREYLDSKFEWRENFRNWYEAQKRGQDDE